jgi:hypothetical protein
MTASNRRWFQFRLRALFVMTTAVAIVAASVVCELDWIRQRREMKAEGDHLFDITWNYVTGATSQDLSPTGSTVNQRLLWLFGEPSVERVYVLFVVEDDIEYEYENVRDFQKVRRAQALFPEAEIVAVDVPRRFVEGPDAFLDNVRGLISN